MIGFKTRDHGNSLVSRVAGIDLAGACLHVRQPRQKPVGFVAFESRRRSPGKLRLPSGTRREASFIERPGAAPLDGWVVVALAIHCIAWACWLERFVTL